MAPPGSGAAQSGPGTASGAGTASVPRPGGRDGRGAGLGAELVPQDTGSSPDPYVFSAGQPLLNWIAPPLAAILTVSLAPNSPSRMRFASGFSMVDWIARFKGRAP